jgi:glycerol dehydrogenase-like iron-containing ADH family enzyme
MLTERSTLAIAHAYMHVDTSVYACAVVKSLAELTIQQQEVRPEGEKQQVLMVTTQVVRSHVYMVLVKLP